MDEPLLFDWDDGNTAHLARHGVTREEAEEVIANQPYFLSVELRDGELRRREVGETRSGRILIVISVAPRI